MRTNSFTQKMIKKSDAELEQIFENKDDYTDVTIQAVIWELENRNLIKKTEVPYFDPPINATLEASIRKELEQKDKPNEELVLPLLYSKTVILGFSILCSTIFGVFLLMSNLKAMNKPRARLEVLIFGISYSIFTVILINHFPQFIFAPVLFNIIGYVVLTQFFWNKNLGKNLQHRKKEIWKPLIFTISIFVLLIFLHFSTQQLV